MQLLELDDRPDGRRQWLASVWEHRNVLGILARADFHARYKRATFGVLWAVAVPVFQSIVLAVVFSRVIRVGDARLFGAYVLAGVLAWSYFSLSVTAASTSIVDASTLTDKVWFPRALLPTIPCLANLPGLAVSIVCLVVALPFLRADIGLRLLLLAPAVVLLLAFTLALGLVLAALDVYFRDVKFLVQAGLLMLFYVTPVAYAKNLLGGLARVVDFNPLTGVVTLFQMAAVGRQAHWQRPVVVSVVATIVLLVVALETQRRHDRLFTDLL